MRVTFTLLFHFFVWASFAQQTVGIFLNDNEAFNGYTLFGNNEHTYLIDNSGYTINIWESDYDPGLGMYLLENGNLLRTAKVNGNFSGGGLGGRFELFNWEGELIWFFQYANSSVHAHHDIEPLPNGNFLAIAWEYHSAAEAQQAGRIGNGAVWSERIVEFEIVGTNQANIVWEWKLWDHLVQDVNSNLSNYGIISDHPELVDINYTGEDVEQESDWVHLNAIAYNKELDQIAVSARNFSEIWIIDHSTTTFQATGHTGGTAGKGGDILYRYGNPQAYDRGDSQDQQFFNQHDIRWIPEGYPNAGKLMVFNNDFTEVNSSVEIWTPPLKEDNSYEIGINIPFGPEQVDWIYSEPGFYSRIMSGAHVLPNGNVFICEAKEGRFFELKPDHTLVWEYINPVNKNGFPISQGGTIHFNEVFRATKYATDFPAFANRDLTPGPPVEINPWDIDCTIHEFPTSSLEPSIISGIKIIGNPFQDFLCIESIHLEENPWFNLFDINGRKISEGNLLPGITNLDLTKFSAGIYLLKVWFDENQYLIKRVVKH